MKLTSVAAMALLVGATAFAADAFAMSHEKPKTSSDATESYGEGREALPGNVGVEGHASNPAVTADDPDADPGMPKAADDSGDEGGMSTLPGNVDVEGHTGGGEKKY